MKRFIINSIMLAFAGNVMAQLNDAQQYALRTYIDRTPALANYDPEIKLRVITDPAMVAQVEKCAQQLKQYGDLEDAMTYKDIAGLYSVLGVNFPEMREVFIPVFHKLDYQAAVKAVGNEKNVNTAMYSTIINLYNAARIEDHFNPENAFGSMQIIHAEQIDELRKAAEKAFKHPVTDDWLNNWLELNYYEKVRYDAVRLMRTQQSSIYLYLQRECLGSLPKIFEEAVEKDKNEPRNWKGTWVGYVFTIEIEERHNYLFGTYYINQNGSSESMTWELTPEGSEAKGKWTMISEDNEKNMVHTGHMTLKIKGDKADYMMYYDGEPTVTWKPDHKPRDLGSFKEAKLYGPLTKKNNFPGSFF